MNINELQRLRRETGAKLCHISGAMQVLQKGSGKDRLWESVRT